MLSFRAFREYVLSNYHTLPFSGGYLEQPEWILDDFELFRDVMFYHVLSLSDDDEE